MDYQELEAFMKLPEPERERRTVQDLWETKELVQAIGDKLSCNTCPFPGCPLKPEVAKLIDHEKIVVGVGVLGVSSGLLLMALTFLFGV